MSDRRHYMTSERDGKGGSGRNHRDHKERDHRAEIQKTAIRVCGDWSEHVSSSGKKYFYNCKTEQSQWETPKGWVEKQSRPSRNDNGRDERHEKESRNHPKASSSYRDDRHHRHHQHSKHIRGPERYDREGRHHDRHDRDKGRYHNADKLSANHHSNNSYSGGHSNKRETDRRENEDTRQSEDMDISPGSTPTEESAFERNMHHHLHHPSSSTPSSAINSNMTMSNMSSGSTPRSSADTINSLPPNVLSPYDADKRFNNQQMTREAIKTLAQLQQALQQAQQQQQQQQRKVQTLLVQQIKQQIDQAQNQTKTSHNSAMDDGSQSPYSPPDSDGTPLQSPEARPTSNAIVRVQDEDAVMRGQDSPCQSEVSMKSSSKRGSPAPSHSSSQSVPVATSQLAAAHRKNDDSVHLTPSLANYYNDKLIDHVSNKPAEVVEAQSDRVREDGLHVGNVQCTQVSAELKRDRSLVRLAEIQCTLQEQRVIFLRQQIKELENL